MKTYLDLCQDAARESGVFGPGQPTSVLNQTGRLAKIVSWVAEAWRLIQLYRDWNFLREEYEGALVPGTSRYTSASFGLPDQSRFLHDGRAQGQFYRPHSVYDPAAGLDAGEWPLTEISWETWRYRYRRGPASSGRPCHFALSPAGELAVGPPPDKAYVIRGEYWRGPQALEAGSDVPRLPARFHPMIAWYAVILLQRHDEAFQAIQVGQAVSQYQAYLDALMADQLPAPTVSYGRIA